MHCLTQIFSISGCLIAHRLDTVALLHMCFPFFQTCHAHLIIFPTHSRWLKACHKTELHLTLVRVDGSFIPGFVFGTGHLVGMQPKKTSNSPALKTPARPSVDITVNAEIVLAREQIMALTTASKVGQTWTDADARTVDDVGRLMLSLPVDSCIRLLQISHMKAQFVGVKHEVFRQCWSTDWSIGRRYVARYEAPFHQDLSWDTVARFTKGASITPWTPFVLPFCAETRDQQELSTPFKSASL